MNILVLCTGNSARSIILEALLNSMGQGRVTAFSAGSQPTGKVHPQSLVILDEMGILPDHARSKSWDEFARDDAVEMDAVITVCASAAGETCPLWPGAPITSHWGVADPAAALEADWAEAFQTAFDTLRMRTAVFMDVPFETMDQATLKRTMDDIGQLM